MIYRPDTSRGLECYVDAGFISGWKDGDHNSPQLVLSRTVFVIIYAGCPINWGNKMKAYIFLITTESDYIALSTSIRELIPFMSLMKENPGVFGLLTRDTVFCYTVWEDNESCINFSKSRNFTPRTEHTAIKYHHFWRFVSYGTIIMNSIDTIEHIVDIFKKPLGGNIFCYLRHQLMGWYFVFRDTLLMYYYYSFSRSVRISER